ncbi:MAG: WS/DGAT domain-containing protein, partial [Gammaproteobacteria bacterium]|nr:WS/DGAT domain-containing protein [Gammaproteobacteria bacterium]
GELIAGAVENVVKSQVRQATRTLDVVETNARLWRRGLDPSAGFGAMVTPAPRTRFNRSIGIKRSYAVGELAVVDVKTAGKKLGATLNDVFLAICGGGIRRYLQREGELPEASLIAGCPVSLRMPGDASMSNQVTMMQVSLGSSESNAARRVVQIKESSTTAKGVTADLAGSVDCDPVAWGLPIAMQEMAVRAEQTRAADRAETPFNVVVSNVPGPRKTLYSNGARMVTHYPVSIPTHGMGVNITMQSYDGTLFFGITGCAEALPDASVLRDDIVAEFVALTEDLAEPGLTQSATVGSDIPVPRVAISLEEPIAIAAA